MKIPQLESNKRTPHNRFNKKTTTRQKQNDEKNREEGG